MSELKPAAIVRSRHGDPEAFGERWLEVVADIQSMPYGAKLYAIPADQVLVPRDLLDALLKRGKYVTANDCYVRAKAICELRALLQR